jgi:hypothetical protein
MAKVGKALYILEYQLNVQFDKYEKRDGYISVTSQNYEGAVEAARTRLPKEIGEKTEADYLYGQKQREYTRTYRHAFRLVDCLDENHALFVPQQQNISVDNSNTNTNYSTSMAISHRSIFG